jgi:hypothetical protein
MSKPSNGYGSYTWPSGNKYTGEWKEGNPHGRGKHEWPNGEIYEGNYSNGKQEGNGVFRWADGRIYDGSWKNGEREGRGVATYAVDGKLLDELGGCSFNANDKIDGFFKAGKRHGACTYTFFNGETFLCAFVEGRCAEFDQRQAAVRAAPDAASVQARAGAQQADARAEGFASAQAKAAAEDVARSRAFVRRVAAGGAVAAAVLCAVLLFRRRRQ